MKNPFTIMVLTSIVASTSPSLAEDITTGVHATGAPTVSSQGVWLQWNRSNGDGATWLLNQKGGGAGGIRLGESDTSNNVTSSGTFTPNAATLPGSLSVAGSISAPLAFPVYNLLNYGADPTGVVDMCAAGGPVQTILSAATGPGLTLYAPGGHGAGFLCNEQIAVSGKSFSFIGDGKDNTIIQFGGTNTGVAVSESTTGSGVKIQGLTLRTNLNQSSAAAISVSYADGSVNVGPTLTVNDVEIDGGVSDTFNWHFGLNCHNCAHASITNINFRGRNENNAPSGISSSNMLAGVNLTGRSTDLSFDGRCIVVFSQYAFYASGDSEGQHYSGCTALADNYGWYLDDLSSGDSFSIQQAPGPQITNSHCDSYISCVYSKGWAELIVTNNLFYKRQESTQNWIAIAYLDGIYRVNGTNQTFGTMSSDAHGNSFLGNANLASHGTSTGIAFGYNGASNLFHDNFASALNYFGNENSSQGHNFVYNNIINPQSSLGLTNNWFQNSSGNTYTYGNEPIIAGNYTDFLVLPQSTTVTLVGLNQTSFFTNSNRLITSLGPFYSGLPNVTINCNDTSTQIQHNFNTQLAGGVNFNCTRAGQSITLKPYNGAWREVSRTS